MLPICYKLPNKLKRSQNVKRVIIYRDWATMLFKEKVESEIRFDNDEKNKKAIKHKNIIQIISSKTNKHLKKHQKQYLRVHH